MNRRLKHVVMFTTFSAACAIVPCLPRLLASPTALQESSQAPQGQKDFQQRALTAERAFVEAAAKSDPAALVQLLDVRYTWTGASGKTLKRQEVQKLIKRRGIRFGGGFDERTFSCQSALLEILLALRGLGGFLQGCRGGQQARQARHDCASCRERGEHHDVFEPAVHGSSIRAGASMIVVPPR